MFFQESVNSYYVVLCICLFKTFTIRITILYLLIILNQVIYTLVFTFTVNWKVYIFM